MKDNLGIILLVLVTIILLLLIGLIYWIVVNTRRNNRTLARTISLTLTRKHEIERNREVQFGQLHERQITN